MSVKILRGDCRDILVTLPANSVHCVVTSPPYWGLRSYLPSDHPDKVKEIGLEPTPAEHVAGLVEAFEAVRRVLRPDGTLWLNYGDCYAGGGRGGNPADSSFRKQATNVRSLVAPTPVPAGLKPKDLVMMPARVALALQAAGWWIRKDIIWSKPNPMPESATDRPTSSHEHVFLLTKSARYFYDADAVREDRIQDEDAASFRGGSYVGGETDNASMGKRKVVGNKRVKIPGGWDRGDGAHGTIHLDGRTSAEYPEATIGAGRNLRDVWTIATAPFPEAHFATFPAALVEPCLKAGTSQKGCCPHCGAPWRRVVDEGAPDMARRRACGADAHGGYTGQSIKGHDAAGVQNASDVKRRILEGMRKKTTTGWRPTCECPAHTPIPCTVLDPFGGSGTVGLVADRLGRDAILIDLHPDYPVMAHRRIADDAGMFAEVA